MQIKEWNDSTSAQEIAELAQRPRVSVVIVAAEHRALRALAMILLAQHKDAECVGGNGRLHFLFPSGACVRFVTARAIWECCLRGSRLDVAYLVDSLTWPLILQDTVRCELAPLIGR
jgi:hypothetical protein